MQLHSPREGEPGQKVGFEITLGNKQKCWVDADLAPKKVSAEWTDLHSGAVKKVTTQIQLPLYSSSGERASVAGLIPASDSPGTYSLSITRIDHLQPAFAAQNVVLDSVPMQTSVNAPSGLSAQYDLKMLPPSFKAGLESTVELTVTNTGKAVWLSTLPPTNGTVALGYSWIDAKGKEVLPGRLYLPYRIYPGDSYDFIGKIAVPSTPGDYTLSLEMVSELVAWFHDLGVPPVESHVQVHP